MACKGFSVFDETINLRFSETLITCQICMNIFESPRILPCQHTFCKECVVVIIQKNCLDAGGKVKKSSFPCPSCRRDCKIRTKEHSSLDEHLKRFPESLLLKQILESIGNINNIIPDIETSDKETQSEDGVYSRERLQDNASREKSSERSRQCYGIFLSLLLWFTSKLNQQYSLSNSWAYQGVSRAELVDFVRRLCRIPFCCNFPLLDITALESSLRSRWENFGQFLGQNNEQTATQDSEVQTDHLRICSPLTCHGFEIIGICLLRFVIFLESYCVCYPVDLILYWYFKEVPLKVVVISILFAIAKKPQSAIYLGICKTTDIVMTLFLFHYSFTKASLVFLGLLIIHMSCVPKMKSFSEINFILNEHKHVYLLCTLSSLSFVQNMYRFARLSTCIIAFIQFDFGNFGFILITEIVLFVVAKALFVLPLFIIETSFWERYFSKKIDIQALQEDEMLRSIFNMPMLFLPYRLYPTR